MPETKIDLSRFCGDGMGRYSLSEPWIRNGYGHATDGTIMVRIPSTEPDTAGKLPPELEAFAKPIGEHLPWPPGNAPCDKCGDTGNIPCKECGGGGVCDKCGEGECHQCHGSGKGGKCAECATKLGARLVNVKYHRLVASLPNVRYEVKDNDCIRFIFDGGDGAVMAMGLRERI